jgi:hypothetical protein
MPKYDISLNVFNLYLHFCMRTKAYITLFKVKVYVVDTEHLLRIYYLRKLLIKIVKTDIFV